MSEFTTYDYVAGGDERQRLDVFAPAAGTTDLRTAVLVLHGGAFRHGDRAAIHPRCVALAQQGLTAVAVGYRLADTAAWPAQLDDARAALQWTREHAAEIGVDAERIVLQGHSAGGLLALLVGAQAAPGSVAAIAAYYSPAALSFTPGPGDLPAPMLLGPAVTPTDVTAASPITHITAQTPPTVLIHGAGDRFMLPQSSVRLFEALTAVGVPAELHFVAGGDHEFDMTPRFADSGSRLVADFVRNQVVEPDLVAKEAAETNPFVSMAPPPRPPAGH